MILDVVERGHHYFDLHPRFAHAFRFLRSADLSTLGPGRHEIEGPQLYVSIDDEEGRGEDSARLEHHRRYADIQVCLTGHERIGWRGLDTCLDRIGEFDTKRDVGFFSDAPQTWISLPPGVFAIFFPADAHAPLAGQGPVRKAIVKVLI